MQWATTTLAVCGLGAAALATSMLTLGRRLELSQAKHRSLAGHARMARRLAGFVPFYDFDEDAVFRQRRRARRHRRPAPRRLLPPVGALQDAVCRNDPLQRRGGRSHFRPAIHRRLSGAVPISPHGARASAARHVPAIVRGRDGHRSRRQPLLRSHRLLRRQRLRLRLLQGHDRARRRPRARARPGARRLSSADHREHAAHQGDFRARRSVVPHVGHRGGDAGGAARALPHAAQPSGALLRRLSRLVGRRAAGHRQSAAGARDLYACGNVRGNAARAAHAPRHRLRAGQSGAGLASERAGADRFVAARQHAQLALRQGGLHRLAQAPARRCAASATSC